MGMGLLLELPDPPLPRRNVNLIAAAGYLHISSGIKKCVHTVVDIYAV